MSILDTFFILFDADTSKLQKGLDTADKKSEQLTDKLVKTDAAAAKTGASFVQLIERGAALAGVTLGFAALLAGIKSTAESYTQLERLALRFRSTTDAIDEFRDSATLIGLSEEVSTGGLSALETAIQDTFLGLGRAKKVFEELGIEVQGLDGKIKPTTQVMGELAERLAKMDRGTQIRVMERLGLDPALLKLFNSDMVDLQRRMAEIDRASGFNLSMAVKRATEYTKASKALGLEVNTLWMFLGKLTESFKVAALPYFTEAMGSAAHYVRVFVDYLMKHSKFVEGVIVAIAGAIAYFLVPSAIRGAIAVWAMIAPFALVGAAAIALVAIFGLLYDDIMAFIEGNDSLIGQLLQRWPAVGEVVRDVWNVVKFLAETVYELGQIIAAVFGAAVGSGQSFGSTLSGLGESLEAVRGVFQGLHGVVSMIFQVWIDLVDRFLDKFGGVAGIAKGIAGGVRGLLDAGRAAVGLPGQDTSDAQSRRAGRLPSFSLGAGSSAAARPGAVPWGLMPGTLPDLTLQGVAAGQGTLQAAAASPLSSLSSASITNSTRGRGGDRTVKIDKVEVQTQATDAEGISRAIGGTLGAQLRQANSQFDDGVAA